MPSVVVGFLAARHWKMPDYVCQAVRWHHDPINVEDQAATLIAILQTAQQNTIQRGPGNCRQPTDRLEEHVPNQEW